MKLKLTSLFLLCIFQLQAQKSKIAPAKPVNKPTVVAKTNNEGIFAKFETSKGNIVLALEYAKTPVTVANFITLAEGNNPMVAVQAKKGKPFYDGLKFHRVIKDFMIQGGDPNGDGSGDPGYRFKDEFTDLKHDKGGILSMANSGPATNGSQFFITHKDTPWLDGKHTVFGHITSGMEVVNAIEQNDLIKKVTIQRVGKNAKSFNALQVFSNYFKNKAEDDKKQEALMAEKKAQLLAKKAEEKKQYFEKHKDVIQAKAAFLTQQKALAQKTNSGLAIAYTQKSNAPKPADKTMIYWNYSGYFEDGTLFDSNNAEVSKQYGMYNEMRDKQGGYKEFPFEVGSQKGMIPGFLEALNTLTPGDKAVVFIPSNLAYGSRGAGDVIPPDANLVFEIEILDKK